MTEFMPIQLFELLEDKQLLPTSNRQKVSKLLEHMSPRWLHFLDHRRESWLIKRSTEVTFLGPVVSWSRREVVWHRSWVLWWVVFDSKGMSTVQITCLIKSSSDIYTRLSQVPRYHSHACQTWRMYHLHGSGWERVVSKLYHEDATIPAGGKENCKRASWRPVAPVRCLA